MDQVKERDKGSDAGDLVVNSKDIAVRKFLINVRSASCFDILLLYHQLFQPKVERGNLG